MRSSTVIKDEGMRVLAERLGLVDAEPAKSKEPKSQDVR